MLSIVIPTLNAERTLGACLSALVNAAADGMVAEVVIADGGSTDMGPRIADEMGCELVTCERGRGQQLAAGAGAARRGDWLMFLHADTVLEDGWHHEVKSFIETSQMRGREQAATFSFRLDDFGFAARWLERMVSLRCALFALPYGDQGLLMPRRMYESLGGYRELPLMEDVDLVRRIGRSRLVMLRSGAVTSAERYRENGYVRRSLRNLGCLALYYFRVPPRVISRIYG
ncbi:TIGR04283 family arsenosugar biosynthesis glycosyltransferase [Tepidamorphus sp. 3E244]|uniref:TIGR04283 family arsenosugar biosynthesis glycosyltransferase n=1 Tax=Tepidamorphus sp. 3E244 TaxID=3385498 RepID=UPI0038FD1B7B